MLFSQAIQRSPGIAVSEQPHPEESNILRYLQQGVFGCFYPDPGLARDVIDLGTMVEKCLPSDALGFSPSELSSRIEPGSVFTDGIWLWPGVLSYYIAKYHLAIDPEFVEHARSRNWTIRESEVRLETLCFDAFTSMDRSASPTLRPERAFST